MLEGVPLFIACALLFVDSACVLGMVTAILLSYIESRWHLHLNAERLFWMSGAVLLPSWALTSLFLFAVSA